MTSPSPEEGTENDSTMTSPNAHSQKEEIRAPMMASADEGSEKEGIQAPAMKSPNGVSEKEDIASRVMTSPPNVGSGVVSPLMTSETEGSEKEDKESLVMTSPNGASEKEEVQSPAEMTSATEKQVLSPTSRSSPDLLTVNEDGGGEEEKEKGDVVEQQPRKETMMEEGWRRLKEVEVTCEGVAVGTLAANDSSKEPLNYDQVQRFVSNFLVFLSEL